MKIKGLLAAMMAALLLLAACGSQSEPSEPGQDGELIQLKVGVVPLAAVAPVYIGIEQGFFEEEGLEITPEMAQGSAAIIPSLVSGNMEFAYSNNATNIIAATQGLSLVILTNGNVESSDGENISSTLVVAGDSDIMDASELAGKRIAVNTLNNIGDITITRTLEQHGVEPGNVEYVELPFPEMIAVLERGEIDAAWLVTPFTEAAEAAGHRVVAYPFYETKPGLSIATYITTGEYAEQNPEVVAAFTRAMNKSLEYTAENPEEIRTATKEFTEIPESVVDQMTLPLFNTEMPVEDLKLLSELMFNYGMIESQPDIDAMIWAGE